MKHIPNILTLIRMALIPFIPYFYIIHDNRLFSILIIGIAALSDILDGYLARHFQLVTELGKVLDPLADKLLLIAIVLSLFYTKNFPMILLVAFLVIEIGMIILGSILYTRPDRIVIAANRYGKIATVFFMLTAILSIWYGYTQAVSILFMITLLLKGYAFSKYLQIYLHQSKT